MRYAAVGDVQSRMPQFTLTTTSKPTIADAELIVDDVTSELEATLSNMGYAIPITGERSLSMVRALVCYSAIARILYARGASIGGDVVFTSADKAQKFYDDKIKALADPSDPLELSDADRTNSMRDKPDSVISGLLADEDGDTITPGATLNQVF